MKLNVASVGSHLNPNPKRKRGAPHTSLTLRVGIGFSHLAIQSMNFLSYFGLVLRPVGRRLACRKRQGIHVFPVLDLNIV